MALNCLECGAPVQPRVKVCGGSPPGFCSEACRLTRKRKTTAQWIKTNHARKMAVDAKYRAHQKQTQPDYFRDFYAKNRERRKREANEWYHANSAYALKRQKAYVATRPIELRRQLGRKNANKRRAIKSKVFVEVVDARVVFERDNGQCGICGERVDPMSRWEVDHIVPISKGGAHAYTNVQLAHRQCNRSKGAKTSHVAAED